MKRIGLISDTHGYMDERILHHLSGVDEIWHAGDIGSLDVTDALRELAPLRVVYGNVDGAKIRAEFPAHTRFYVEGLKVWMTHIGGRPGRYDYRLRDELRRSRADFFICGHSHICLVKKDSFFGGVYMNPGAAGRHGFHRTRTLLRFSVASTGLQDLEVVELGPRSAIET